MSRQRSVEFYSSSCVLGIGFICLAVSVTLAGMCMILEVSPGSMYPPRNGSLSHRLEARRSVKLEAPLPGV